MNQYKKITRCGLILLAVLALMFSSVVTAFAADGSSLDFSKTGSVTLTLADSDGNTVSGGEITIYEVASIYLDDGDMAYALTDEFKNCTAVLDVTDTSLPSELAQYVKENGVTGTSAVVGTDGAVSFAGLELGLYLVVQTTSSDNYETINPFVVTVPIEDGDAWDYSVNASPKVGTVTLTEPTEPEEPTEPDEPTEPNEPTDSDEPDTPDETTSTPSEPTLPQTGQLNWPVPVLAGCGLLLFALGWVLRRTGRKKQNV